MNIDNSEIEMDDNGVYDTFNKHSFEDNTNLNDDGSYDLPTRLTFDEFIGDID